MEQLYIRQILAGNTARFSYFIDGYKDMAFSIAYRITRNREDAEEIVQDSFLKVYQSLAKFREDAKFSTWLYKIVVNTSFSKMRKEKPDVASMDAGDLDVEETRETDNAYKTLSKQEQVKYINQVLEEMETEDSLVLTLYYLNENDLDEIAEITGIKAENIKMRLHRARKKMYTALEKKLKTETHSLL
jgi:RNA polymerase sigma-70 factor (ECF subfamily)